MKSVASESVSLEAPPPVVARHLLPPAAGGTNRTGAHLVWASLAVAGVKIVFGYPGGAVIPLYDTLAESGIRHILTRHEQGAAFAASGYARASGRVGVAIATSGPGATNLVTGIADAKMDSVPLLCITGQVRTSLLGTDAFQETDIIGMTLPLTKWSRMVRSVQEIPAVLARALAVAREGRPGPVLVDIPVDILKLPANAAPLAPAPLAAAPMDDAAIAEAARLLGAAAKPVVLVGGGVRLSGALHAVRRLLDFLAIPTAATLHGLGVIPPAAPYWLGMAGMHGSPAANRALHGCDLLLVLGARLDDRVTGEPAQFAPGARIAHFDIDPAQLDRVRPAEVHVVGDLATTAPRLLRAVGRLGRPTVASWRRAAHTAGRTEASQGIHPAARLMDELYSLLPADAIVIADVGQHQMWAAQRYRSASPHGWMTSGGLGAMGFALPAAIGAQLARPRATVVCISGDGGFQMNVQELATLRRYSLPIKCLIVDNKYLGMVRQWQQLFHDRNYAETDLSDNPDFIALGAAYGIAGARLAAAPDDSLRARARAALREFVTSPEARLLVFDCPPEANVFPMVAPGAGLSRMLLGEAG